MTKRVWILLFCLLSLLSACQRDSKTIEPGSHPEINLLKPGDSIGEMKLVKAIHESMPSSFFFYCTPYLGSEPTVVTTECQLPQSNYLFVGYGEFANSASDLDSQWSMKTWELYIDGLPVDLDAFGTLDVDLGKKVRVWAVALENTSKEPHTLRYVAREMEKPQNVIDLTWSFIMVEQSAFVPAISSPMPTPSFAPGKYPLLSSIVNVGMHPYKSESTDLNFMFYVPNGYQKDHRQKVPLVLYLHGTSLRGSDLNKLRIGEFTAILQYKLDFPFLVIAPQLPASDEFQSWSRNEVPEMLFTLLDEIQGKYAVDPKRIYLTGSSLGGGGTWEIGLSHREYFAALIPVMGFYGYPFEVPVNICDLKEVPVWAFHGENDLTVPLKAEQDVVDALRACGGNVQFTIFPGAGHDIEAQVYQTPELFEWMLDQSLE